MCIVLACLFVVPVLFVMRVTCSLLGFYSIYMSNILISGRPLSLWSSCWTMRRCPWAIWCFGSISSGEGNLEVSSPDDRSLYRKACTPPRRDVKATVLLGPSGSPWQPLPFLVQPPDFVSLISPATEPTTARLVTPGQGHVFTPPLG